MLEKILITTLLKKIDETVLDRGRNPITFKIIAIILFCFFLLCGFLAGIVFFQENIGEMGSLFSAILMMGAGTNSASILVENCKKRKVNRKKWQYESLNGSKKLQTPCQIQITLKKSFPVVSPNYYFYMNGQYAGELGKSKSIQISTGLAQNVIVARRVFGKNVSGIETEPLFFMVPSGENAEIFLDSKEFLPELCNGIRVLTEKDISTLTNQVTKANLEEKVSTDAISEDPGKQKSFKIAAILNILSGIFLCIVSFVWLSRTLIPVVYLFIRYSGFIFTILGIIASFQCFIQKVKARAGFLVTQFIIASFTCSIIIIFILATLLNFIF